MTMPTTHRASIDVQALRGEIVETQHTVLAAVADEGGALVIPFGDVDRMVFRRSAIKPLQTLPLIETGAADFYGLCDAEGLSSALLREPSLAVVVKVIDGAKRAVEAALVPRFVALEGEPESVLARPAQSTMGNWRGIHTGYIRVVMPT